MPSTLVHVAMGALFGAALLGADFDRRTAAVVAAAAAVPDLDVAVEPFLTGAHRSLGHTFLLPAGLAAVVLWDTRYRRESWLRTRFGDRGVRIAWTSLFVLVGAGIVPDLTVGGVNAFYPLHDAFYTVDGRVLYSTDRGFVQTLVDLSPPEPKPRRTTDNFAFRTVLDARPAAETKNPERIFPVAMTGYRFGVLVVSTLVVGVRLRENGRRESLDDAGQVDSAASGRNASR
jgi:hypothetical protein